MWISFKGAINKAGQKTCEEFKKRVSQCIIKFKRLCNVMNKNKSDRCSQKMKWRKRRTEMS